MAGIGVPLPESIMTALEESDYEAIYDSLLGDTAGAVRSETGWAEVETFREEATRLIDVHGLRKWHDTKITLQDVMKVGSAHAADDCNGEGEDKDSHTSKVIFNWLRKLIYLDVEARDRDVLSDKSLTCSVDESESDSDNEFKLDDDDFGVKSDRLHPLDFILLVYPLCDIQLKQLLASKLFLCRQAIPLLYPDYYSGQFELNLTSLSNLCIDYKVAKEESKLVPCTDVKAPCVSFVKMGPVHSASKSHILNYLLDPRSHATFVHWNVLNGSQPRHISHGLIEVSWFLPKSTDDSGQAMTILNLRGDGFSFPNHIDFLSANSTVIVLFVEACNLKTEFSNTLNKLSSEVKIIIIVAVTKNETSPKLNVKKFKESITHSAVTWLKFDANRNISTFTTDLQTKLHEAIEGSSKRNLALNAFADQGIFHIDSNEYTTELGLVQSIWQVFHSGNVTSSFENNLPLQGNPWIEWTGLSKKYHRNIYEELMKDVTTEFHIKEALKQKMNKCRNIQRGYLSKISPAMKQIIALILHGSKLKLLLFLNALSTKFGTLRQGDSSKHRDEYSIQTPKPCKAIQSKVDNVQDIGCSRSIGLEHIFREIGQIYEAGINSAYKVKYKQLPAAVASLVVQGQPFELIDGDAGNVAITWVTDVLKSIKQQLGDKKIFVLSVLGIQSSGKSTLLNTMFGVQFAVSAGRCTKGVYMQVVKADSETMPFDYILVLDTEGLRSAELDENTGKFRDNELATFVIGIADTTIINVKGENYAEMQDFIQIAVTAFLRMTLIHKNFNENKKCIFVHQNTPAANAKVKNALSCRNLLDALDKMTIYAAKQEKLGTSSFNEVIRFDCENDVWYFPDLWQGNPPMAHVNQGYSLEVQRVRDAIFGGFHLDQSEKFKTFSYFTTYVNDLWTSILKENFIFSFQNCLEIRAHSMLDKKYRVIMHDAQSELFAWENDKLKDDNCEGDFAELERTLSSDLKKELAGFIETLKVGNTQILVQYVAKNPDANIMSKWLPARLNLLASSIDDISSECHSRLMSRIADKRQEQEVRRLEAIHKERLMILATEAAETKGISNETDLKDEFEKIWLSISPVEYELDTSKAELRVQSDINRVLYERFPKDQAKVSSALEVIKLDKDEEALISVSAHTLGKDHLRIFDSESKQEFSPGDQEWELGTKVLLQKVSDDLVAKLTRHMSSMKEDTYDLSLIRAQIELVQSWGDQEISDGTICIIILPSLVTILAVRACKQLYQLLCDLVSQRFSLKRRMDEYKDRLWRFLKASIESVSYDTSIADHVCLQLKENILTSIKHDMKKHIDEEIYTTFDCKRSFLKFVLTQLLTEKRNFDQYVRYFKSPKSVAKEILASCIDRQKKAQDHGEWTKRFLDISTNCLQVAAESFSSESEIKASEWVKTFGELFQQRLSQLDANFTLDTFVDTVMITNLETLNGCFIECMQNMLGDVMGEVMKLSVKEVGFTKGAVSDTFKVLWGCKSSCPFCGEPCCHSINNHYDTCDTSHRCTQHRPMALKGKHVKLTNREAIFTCPYMVSQNDKFGIDEQEFKYSDYKTVYPHWEINPYNSIESSKYWLHFFARFRDELSAKFKLDDLSVPPSWFEISDSEAVASLDELI